MDSFFSIDDTFRKTTSFILDEKEFSIKHWLTFMKWNEEVIRISAGKLTLLNGRNRSIYKENNNNKCTRAKPWQ
jgi:hypothetical protein